MVPTRNKTILAVDDDVTLLRALSKRLLTSGYEVVTARNGVEALARVGEQQVDCVLLDIGMPGEIDGFGVAASLHEDRVTSGIPVIFLTGSADEDLKRRCQSIGVKYFVAKPYDADLLLRVLDGIFAKDDLGELRLFSQAKRRQPVA